MVSFLISRREIKKETIAIKRDWVYSLQPAIKMPHDIIYINVVSHYFSGLRLDDGPDVML